MRIKNVRIHLFGKSVNRDYADFSDELTVFEGKNESGKTTLKEFIRTTLFPASERKRYPETTGLERGEIDCITDSGEKFTIRRNRNKADSDGKMAAIASGIDAGTYKGVYAMGPEELVDTGIVSSGDIRRRFLTVPGGENMPEITSAIDTEMSNLLSEKRISKTKGIGQTEEELDSVRAKIEEAKRIESGLAGLGEEKKRLESELESLRGKQAESVAVNAKIEKRKDQEKSIERLGELKKLMEGAAEADRAPETLETFNRLSLKEKQLAEQKNAAEAELKTARDDLDGADAALIASRKEDILKLNENIGAYESTVRNLESLRRKKKEASVETKPHPAGKNNIAPYTAILVASIAIMMAGVTFSTVVLTVVGIVLAAVSIVLLVSKSQGKESAEKYEKPGEDTDRLISETETEIENLETLLNRTASGILFRRTSFGNDVRALARLLNACDGAEKAAARFKEAEIRHADAANELNAYLAPYGSEEELRRLYALRKNSEAWKAEAENIRNILNDAGISSEEVPEEPAEDYSERIEELVKEITRRDGEIKAVLSDTDIERLYDREASLRARLDREVREWIVLSAEKTLSDRACGTIYEEMQPGIIETADRYLEMMTGGRYRMETDPRVKDVAVREGSEVKDGGKWSSGLAAQVCLSLKLAVAKELSKEKLPVLLDDVLLVFDSERKMGACKAIAEAAKDMQIILFTCDKETAEFMKAVGADVRGMDA